MKDEGESMKDEKKTTCPPRRMKDEKQEARDKELIEESEERSMYLKKD